MPGTKPTGLTADDDTSLKVNKGCFGDKRSTSHSMKSAAL